MAVKKLLSKEAAQKMRLLLRKSCKRVLAIDNGNNRYDAYFALKGKYAGLSILAKTSEGDYYYFGPYRSMPEWEQRPQLIKELRCVRRELPSLLSDPKYFESIKHPKIYHMSSSGVGHSCGKAYV